MTEDIVKRGDVWLLNFDPTIGSEINKTRPGIVLSIDKVGRLPIKIVIPITTWRAKFKQSIWHLRLEPDEINGLSQVSSADILQIRAIDLQRFVRKIGKVEDSILEEMVFGLIGIVSEQEFF